MRVRVCVCVCVCVSVCSVMCVCVQSLVCGVCVYMYEEGVMCGGVVGVCGL